MERKLKSFRNVVLAVFAAAAFVSPGAVRQTWATEDERDFMRRRAERIDIVPGSPETDAIRVYSNYPKGAMKFSRMLKKKIGL